MFPVVVLWIISCHNAITNKSSLTVVNRVRWFFNRLTTASYRRTDTITNLRAHLSSNALITTKLMIIWHGLVAVYKEEE
jgi:hypothetical protein